MASKRTKRGLSEELAMSDSSKKSSSFKKLTGLVIVAVIDYLMDSISSKILQSLLSNSRPSPFAVVLM